MLNGTIYIWYTKTRKECFTFEKKEIISKLKKSASVVTLSKKLGVYSNVLKKMPMKLNAMHYKWKMTAMIKNGKL